MTRSIKALSGAAFLAALTLPTVASAQDTTMTRTTRDSAGGRNMRSMQGVRFDTTQAVTLTGVTIARIDSSGGGAGAWNGSARGGMDASGAGSTGTASSAGTATGTTGAGTRSATGTSTTGTGGSTGTTAIGAMGTARGAVTPNGSGNAGQTLSAVVLSGSDSMHVVLGPSDYLASQQLTLAAGDVISIKGVRIQAGASGMGAGASGTMSDSATGSTTGSSSTGSTMGTSGASGAMTTVLATEVTKNGKTIALRDKSTGMPNWGMSGTEAGRNRGGMTPPGTTRDTSSMKKDTTSTKKDTIPTSPVRKP